VAIAERVGIRTPVLPFPTASQGSQYKIPHWLQTLLMTSFSTWCGNILRYNGVLNENLDAVAIFCASKNQHRISAILENQESRIFRFASRCASESAAQRHVELTARTDPVAEVRSQFVSSDEL
jgi:hypothetical protein